jgi:hypothetical protein
MKFPTYAAAVAYVTAWCGNAPYTLTVVDTASALLGEIKGELIEDLSQTERDWVLEAFSQSGEKTYGDATISVESGDAQLGYILVFFDEEGDTERVYAHSIYY